MKSRFLTYGISRAGTSIIRFDHRTNKGTMCNQRRPVWGEPLWTWEQVFTTTYFRQISPLRARLIMLLWKIQAIIRNRPDLGI
jgi:hypothetical protein